MVDTSQPSTGTDSCTGLHTALASHLHGHRRLTVQEPVKQISVDQGCGETNRTYQTDTMKKQAFTGGLRTPGFNATWPFARLTLSDDGLTLRLCGLIHTRSDWLGIANAQRVVGGLMGSSGVRITLNSGRQLVFWAWSPQAVLDALQSRGVSILDSGKKPPKVWLGT
jgi:hypothetical protein